MMKQQRRQGIALALTTVAAMLLALPGIASAEKGDRHDREQAKKERRHHGDDRAVRNTHRDHDHNGGRKALRDARHELRDARSEVSEAKRNLKEARSDRRGDARQAKRHHDDHWDARRATWIQRYQRRYDARHDARHRGHDHERASRRYSAKRHEEQAVFYCKPCSRRFGTRQGLFSHAHRNHRTAFRRFSRHFVNHGLGWTFYG